MRAARRTPRLFQVRSPKLGLGMPPLPGMLPAVEAPQLGVPPDATAVSSPPTTDLHDLAPQSSLVRAKGCNCVAHSVPCHVESSAYPSHRRTDWQYRGICRPRSPLIPSPGTRPGAPMSSPVMRMNAPMLGVGVEVALVQLHKMYDGLHVLLEGKMHRMNPSGYGIAFKQLVHEPEALVSGPPQQAAHDG
jgi:hypothetical protein